MPARSRNIGAYANQFRAVSELLPTPERWYRIRQLDRVSGTVTELTVGYVSSQPTPSGLRSKTRAAPRTAAAPSFS